MVCAVRLRTHNQWSRIDCPSPHFLAWGIFDRGRTPHTHTRTHTHTHTHTPHPQTQLIRTQLTHTYSSTHNLLHTNESPSLFSFLLTPCRLCLSFVACWKKLTCGVIRSFNFGLYFYGVFTYFLLIYAYLSLSLYICYSPMRLHTHTRIYIYIIYIYIYHMLMKNLTKMEMHVVLRCLLVTRWSPQKTLQSEWSWGRVLDLPSIFIPYGKPFWDLKIFTQKSAIKQLPSQTNCVAAQGRAARRLNIHVVQPSTDKAQENEKSANPDPAHQPQHQASHYCFPRAKTTGWVSLSITPSRPKRKSS